MSERISLTQSLKRETRHCGLSHPLPCRSGAFHPPAKKASRKQFSQIADAINPARALSLSRTIWKYNLHACRVTLQKQSGRVVPFLQPATKRFPSNLQWCSFTRSRRATSKAASRASSSSQSRQEHLTRRTAAIYCNVMFLRDCSRGRAS